MSSRIDTPAPVAERGNDPRWCIESILLRRLTSYTGPYEHAQHRLQVLTQLCNYIVSSLQIATLQYQIFANITIRLAQHWPSLI
jgi:hypothetical protein